MSEYYLLLLSRYQRPIQQVVLYVAQPRMRMTPTFEHGPLRFSYSLHDIREWPARKFLDSSRTADNVLAILAGTADDLPLFAMFSSDWRGGSRKRGREP